MTRAPVDTIIAPAFLPQLEWLNTEGKRLYMHLLADEGPVLVEFWDFCRPNSIRTLPYIREWHRRYSPEGLRVVGIHSPGFEPARDRAALVRALERLEIEHPVLVDPELEMWREYENQGWPARYLFDGRGRLFEYHYGEGAYAETELAIQSLLGLEGPTMEPVRPEDDPQALLAPQTQDQQGPYSGPYAAGGVWLVLEGEGTVRATAGDPAAPIELELAVGEAGAYRLVEHAAHTDGTLDLRLSAGLGCLATCFTPGIAAG